MTLAKRITASLLTMFMCLFFSALIWVANPAYAYETSGNCGDDITWVWDASTSTLELTGTGETVNNYNSSVNERWGYVMSPWLENGWASEIKTAKIGEGITSLGRYFFYGCSSLETVEFPSTLESIGTELFWKCSSIKEVDFSNTRLNAADTWTFEDCTSLKKVTLPETMESLPNSFYARAYALEEVNWPQALTKIGSYVFRECTSLKEITIPSTVTEIGYDCFYLCTGLEKARIDAQVKAIGSEDYDETFYGCSALQTVQLPDTLESVGYEMFFECSSLKSVVLPKSVTAVGGSAFQECPALTSIDLGSTETIGMNAFRGCIGLTQIVLPSTTASIDMQAFQNCTSLKYVLLPESVTNVDAKAFTKLASGSSLIVMNKTLYDEIADYPSYWITTARTKVYNSKIPLKLTVSVANTTYGSKVASPKVTGNESSGKLTVSYFSDKAMTKKVSKPSNAGTYYVRANVTEGTFHQPATASASFTVAKATPTVKVKASSYKVSYGKNYKKGKTTKKLTGKKSVAFKASSGGKATIAATAKSGKVSIAKSGKITVKKGCKKGTYTLKVKVNVAAKGNYDKLSKKVVKVKVKVAK